ncbi:hypothetical protein SprV_0100123300 [Sparganum proliferum]
MGRGGVRGKASSASQPYDTEAVFIPVNLNVSVFEFLLTGHFEQDYLSYCANRLNDYSCVYWFDPTVSFDLKVDGFGLKGESGSASRNFRDLRQSALVGQTLEDSHGLFPFFEGVGTRGWNQNTSKTLLLVNDLIKLQTPGLWALILPLLYVFAILIYLPTLHAMRRLSISKLPIASFVDYILMLEFVGLILQLADCLLVLFKGIRVLTITQFVGRSACQSLSMANSCFRHVQGLLYLCLALDTLRYAKNPRYRYVSFSRNCAYNILILAAALMATMDSQFFWTFDLSGVENHITSGDVDVLYQCDFLSTWPLNPIFVSYLWPLADHLLQMEKHARLVRSPFPKRRLLEQAIWILPIFYMLNGSSILPRLLYYGIKYFLFAGDHPVKLGAIFYEETDVGQPANLKTVVVKKTYRQSLGSGLLWHMQVAEHTLQFIPPLFALLKAGLLIGGLNEARRLTLAVVSRPLKTHWFRAQIPRFDKMATTETVRNTSPPNTGQQLRRQCQPDSERSVERPDTGPDGDVELTSLLAREQNTVASRGLTCVPSPKCEVQKAPGNRRVQNLCVEEFSV